MGTGDRSGTERRWAGEGLSERRELAKATGEREHYQCADHACRCDQGSTGCSN
jgi:hypothetical protein